MFRIRTFKKKNLKTSICEDKAASSRILSEYSLLLHYKQTVHSPGHIVKLREVQSTQSSKDSLTFPQLKNQK